LSAVVAAADDPVTESCDKPDDGLDAGTTTEISTDRRPGADVLFSIDWINQLTQVSVLLLVSCHAAVISVKTA
jgi:hypothetical protein